MIIIIVTYMITGRQGAGVDERAASVLAGRQTGQRRALLSFLTGADRCLSAQEIHAELARSGSPVSLATIYRTLARLVGAGVLDVVSREDGEATYVLGSPRHHHHLVCRVCGRADEIADPAIARWADDQAARRGFTDATHDLTVVGVCPACTALASGRGAEG